MFGSHCNATSPKRPPLFACLLFDSVLERIGMLQWPAYFGRWLARGPTRVGLKRFRLFKTISFRSTLRTLLQVTDQIAM